MTFGLLVIYENCHWLCLFIASSESWFSTLPGLVCSAATNSSALASDCREKLATTRPRAWRKRGSSSPRSHGTQEVYWEGKAGEAAGDGAETVGGDRVSVPIPISLVLWRSTFFNLAMWFIGGDPMGSHFLTRGWMNLLFFIKTNSCAAAILVKSTWRN
jgi:hypothetical protein